MNPAPPTAPRRVLFVFNSNEHLGITWLSALLKAAGHEVRLAFDPQPFRGEPLLRVPALVRLLDCRDHIVQSARRFDPDLVCYSCYTDNLRWMLGVASRIKRALPRALNVFGGVHVLAAPEAVIAHPQVDALVLGEAFEALPELVAASAGGRIPPGIPNVWTRAGERIERSPIRPYLEDLGRLPIRDFDLFYRQVPAMERNYLTMASFGCPYSCAFCSVDAYHRAYREIGDRRRLRWRPVEQVLEELRVVKARGRVRQISFMDSVFTADRRWLEPFLDGYRRTIGLPFWCYTYPGAIDRELARELARAGCWMITLGVQSGSATVRRSTMNRRESDRQIETAAEAIHAGGIRLATDKIAGSPGENASDRAEDLTRFRALRPDRLLGFPLSYYPGTEMVRRGVESGDLTEQDVAALTQGRLVDTSTRGPLAEEPRAYRAQGLQLALIPLLGRREPAAAPWVERLAALPGSGALEPALVAANALRMRDRKFFYLLRLTLAQSALSIVRRARGLVGLAALVGAGCHRDAPAAPPATPIRLVDLLPAAELHGPLADLDPEDAAARTELAAIPGTELLRISFDEKSLEEIGWPAEAGGDLVPRARQGGRAFRFRGSDPEQFLLQVPAQPAAFYRFGRSIRAAAAPRVDLSLIESRRELLHPADPSHPADRPPAAYLRVPGKHEAILIHRLPAPPPDGAWHRGTRTIATSPQTRSLIVLLRPATAGWALMTEDRSEQGTAALLLDDLVLEKLEPSRPQELALVAREDQRAGAAAAKRGRLLPGLQRRPRPPFDHNLAVRDALFAPAPTRIAFELEPPPGAELSFACGLSKRSALGDQVEFRILAGAAGREQMLFAERRATGAAGETWHWTEERIELPAPPPGRPLRLVLETRAPAGGRGYGLWANPTVDVARRPGDPPNVILLAIDTLRWDRLSSYGYRRPTSPHIDALAAAGVRFEVCVSPTNWTVPAFASLFTGLLPSHHGVQNFAAHTPLDPRLVTLAERFQTAGWNTQAVLYKAALYDGGFDQGFDAAFNVPRIAPRAAESVDTALEWLTRNRDRRFFLMVHFDDPHQPFCQPEPFASPFADSSAALAGVELPLEVRPASAALLDPGDPARRRDCEACGDQAGLSPEFKELARTLYDGEVAYTDQQIGRLLAGLRRLDLYDDALIALVADHGEVLWDHRDHFGHGWFLYDALVRVPLILKPGAATRFQPGTVVRPQVRLIDLAPTLAELAGLPPSDQPSDAESLVPFLDPGSGAQGRLAICEGSWGQLAVRHEGWKYILDSGIDDPPTEALYHVDADPDERQNLVADEPGRLRRLRALAVDYLLRNRWGAHLVVSGAEAGRDYQVRLSAEPADLAPRSRFGPAFEPADRPGEFLARGQADDSLLLVARLEPVDGLRLRVEVEVEGAPAPALTRSLSLAAAPPYAGPDSPARPSSPALEIALYRTDRTSPAAPSAAPLDARQQDALRALGYVD